MEPEPKMNNKQKKAFLTDMFPLLEKKVIVKEMKKTKDMNQLILDLVRLSEKVPAAAPGPKLPRFVRPEGRASGGSPGASQGGAPPGGSPGGGSPSGSQGGSPEGKTSQGNPGKEILQNKNPNQNQMLQPEDYLKVDDPKREMLNLFNSLSNYLKEKQAQNADEIKLLKEEIAVRNSVISKLQSELENTQIRDSPITSEEAKSLVDMKKSLCLKFVNSFEESRKIDLKDSLAAPSPLSTNVTSSLAAPPAGALPFSAGPLQGAPTPFHNFPGLPPHLDVPTPYQINGTNLPYTSPTQYVPGMYQV
eukprot:TRINITY_DN3457_c0_g1_i1.p1 TRINITY_DN3457_c0_g1~~TRINITY_DN3457_c0_g1_i1.p1  ORF type:complete len:305 (-),score=80.89 TRINITY_DN3457_c0_g1_i1:56-970(-)